ncbi:MAG: branched-chain amino acid ABC transporter permease [Albimonas sp.]|uniref:branched-chain amino acid ABC transporter permease n=1 Tax=Albimonas sp. TaxID=1872425 RepID=UPI00405629F7|tara:strand:- start:1335 stop:2279 length:945 start_codon:yes stop_codon:yes gene_type:complete
MTGFAKPGALHLAVALLLLAANFLLPEYHHGAMARVLTLAVFALGYNVMFGYTGLLSLGHALFFAAGLYGMGLPMQHLGLAAEPAFFLGIFSGALVAAAVGALALRTAGVAFMIVTLMFAQAGYLTILYFLEYTRGDEGFVIAREARFFFGLDLAAPDVRYLSAWALFTVAMFLVLALVRSPAGRVLVAIRENEERARMLGYDVARYKLGAIVISGALCGAAGAAYGLLFGYVGATFASVQYSILPLLWVLLGGAGTVLGPLLGATFMFYLIDLSSGITDAYMLIAGAALVILTLFAPAGLLGELRRRALPWLP